MGGHSSGRYRTKSRGALETAMRLEMKRVRKCGFLRPGAASTGAMRWTRGGEPAGSITLATDLTHLGDPFAVLSYSVGGEPRVQRVQLDAVPCRFGGHRFFWRCPVSGRRCLTLAYANGRFASRQAQRLTYAVQSEDGLDRIRRARDKAEARAYGRGGHPRPRGANRERLLDRWWELDCAFEGGFAETVNRRWGHLL
jgi:hypothetical protein